ncbi:MAG: hypothetical protein PVJ57_16835 [Phycisphaerae bacterium]|jgi:hypothetical protein
MSRFIGLTLFVGLVLVGSAAGDFQYVERYSSASIYGEIDGAPPPNDWFSDGASTSGFGPFTGQFEDEIAWGGVTVGGSAEQNSWLQPAVITCDGEAFAEIDAPALTEAYAESTSMLEVVFDLSAATPVELTGHMYLPPGMGPPDVDNSVTLEQQIGGGWTTLYEVMYENDVDYAATLVPGRYRLNVFAQVAVDAATVEPPLIGAAFYEVSMHIVPEPAALALPVLAVPLLRRR